MVNNRLIATPITDKNGKKTTVHKAPVETAAENNGWNIPSPLTTSPKVAPKPVATPAKYVHLTDEEEEAAFQATMRELEEKAAADAAYEAGQAVTPSAEGWTSKNTDAAGTTRYLDDSGKLHRLYGLAVENADGSGEYWEDGEKYGTSTPGSLGFTKSEESVVSNEYDERDFDSNGIHRLTGTPFDQYGKNKDGIEFQHGALFIKDSDGKVDFDGFAQTWDADNSVWNTTHHLTGTKYDPDGYDRQGWNAEGVYRGGITRDGRTPDGAIATFNTESEASNFAQYSTDAEVLADIYDHNRRGEYDDGHANINIPMKLIWNDATPAKVLVHISENISDRAVADIFKHPNMTDEVREEIYERAAEVDFKLNVEGAMGGFNSLPPKVQSLMRLSKSDKTPRALKIKVNKRLRELGLKD